MQRLAILPFLLLGTSALAADLGAPPPARSPAFNWSGFYAGVNGGWGSADGSLTANGLITASGNDVSGALAGGQLGFNWQAGALVVGVEGDYQWADQHKTTTFGVFEERTSLNSSATLRGRAGIAVDRVLLYGTAGGAWLNGKDRLDATIGGTPVELISLSLNGWGWTAGGGVEVAALDNLTVKAEYLYLQSTSVSGSAPIPLALGGGTLTATGKVHDHIGRVGVNYKF